MSADGAETHEALLIRRRDDKIASARASVQQPSCSGLEARRRLAGDGGRVDSAANVAYAAVEPRIPPIFAGRTAVRPLSSRDNGRAITSATAETATKTVNGLRRRRRLLPIYLVDSTVFTSR